MEVYLENNNLDIDYEWKYRHKICKLFKKYGHKLSHDNVNFFEFN